MAKLLFLQNMSFEFMGPMYIAAYAGRRHSVKLSVGDSLRDFKPVIESFAPDVVAFSAMTGMHAWAVRLAREIKKKYPVLTLMGGAHATFFPEVIEEDGIDVICRGEGEEATEELLDHIDAGTDIAAIRNLSVKRQGRVHTNDVRPLQTDLDAYPFPDRELYAAAARRMGRDVVRIITSRGCMFRCSFCFEESMRALYRGKGHYVRTRSIENVLQELRGLKQRYGTPSVYFCDDTFGVNKAWLYPFLERYAKEIGLEFICLVRADIVCSDESYARRLYAAGCRNVFFGIESGSEHIRNNVLKKNLTDQHIYRAAELLHGAGLRFRTYNIVGLPDETLDDAFRTIDMNVAIKTDYPWCSLFSPYPRTALASYAVEKGYLGTDFTPNDISPSFFVDSRLRCRDIRKLENLQKFFQTAVLWPWTLPVIKLLIRFPPNIFYRLWFGLIYFHLYLKSERRKFLATFLFALRNGRHVIGKK